MKKKSQKKDEQAKKDIKKAVDKIPGLIFEQIEFKKPEINKVVPPAKKINKKEPNYSSEKNTTAKAGSRPDGGKKTLMWFGVIVITIAVVVMWSWNTKAGWNTISKMNKNILIETAKESFENAQKQTIELETIGEEKIEENSLTNSTSTEQINNLDSKDKIETALSNLIQVLKNSTSTTSTENSTTSTTIEN